MWGGPRAAGPPQATYNPLMHPLLYASTVFLVLVLSAAIVWAAHAYWRKRPVAPLRDRATLAIMFAFVGWQAIDWLRETPPPTGIRSVGVWLQLVSAFALAALLLIIGWLPSTASGSRHSRGEKRSSTWRAPLKSSRE
jgi:hypothetical protein